MESKTNPKVNKMHFILLPHYAVENAHPDMHSKRLESDTEDICFGFGFFGFFFVCIFLVGFFVVVVVVFITDCFHFFFIYSHVYALFGPPLPSSPTPSFIQGLSLNQSIGYMNLSLVLKIIIVD
jgi:hypothetical protein